MNLNSTALPQVQQQDATIWLPRTEVKEYGQWSNPNCDVMYNVCSIYGEARVVSREENQRELVSSVRSYCKYSSQIREECMG